jgi:hypothetical protein
VRERDERFDSVRARVVEPGVYRNTVEADAQRIPRDDQSRMPHVQLLEQGMIEGPGMLVTDRHVRPAMARSRSKDHRAGGHQRDHAYQRCEFT